MISKVYAMLTEARDGHLCRLLRRKVPLAGWKRLLNRTGETYTQQDSGDHDQYQTRHQIHRPTDHERISRGGARVDMSSGGCPGRVEGGCKNGRGGIDGEGNRGDGKGEGDEIRGVCDDPFQETNNFLG